MRSGKIYDNDESSNILGVRMVGKEGEGERETELTCLSQKRQK
jgi:hypothetical protein